MIQVFLRFIFWEEKSEKFSFYLFFILKVVMFNIEFGFQLENPNNPPMFFIHSLAKSETESIFENIYKEKNKALLFHNS